MHRLCRTKMDRNPLITLKSPYFLHRALSSGSGFPQIQRMKLNFSRERTAEDRIRAQVVNVLTQQSRYNTQCNALFTPCSSDPELDEQMRRLYFNAVFNDAAQHSGVWFITDPEWNKVIAVCLLSVDGGMNGERTRAPEPNWKPFGYKCNSHKLDTLLDDINYGEEIIVDKFTEICKQYHIEKAVYIEYLAVDKQKEGTGLGSKLLQFVIDDHVKKGYGVVLGTSNNNLVQGFFERKCGMLNLSKNGGTTFEMGGRVVDNYWLISYPQKVMEQSKQISYPIVTNKGGGLSNKICRDVIKSSFGRIG